MRPPAALERFRPIIDDWSAFAEALERPLPSSLLANESRISAEALEQRLAGQGIVTRPLGWRPGALRLLASEVQLGRQIDYVLGLCQMQEEASLLPTLLLDAQPGERVLDLCAAPGSKTVHLALAMKGRGTVVANDVSYQRVRAIRAHLDRLGLVNVVLTRHNAAHWPNRAGSFDRVLADVPCSCLGTSRKSEAAERYEGVATSVRLQELQLAILRRALAVCRSGGRVVYSTCTYAPEENELVIARALAEFGDDSFRILPLRPRGLKVVDGLTAWQGQTLPPELAGTMRLWPHHNDTGGFFVAVLEKLAPSSAAAATPQPMVRAEDADRWLAPLQERLSFPPELFTRHTVVSPNRKFLALVSAELTPPEFPLAISAGILLLRRKGRFPKLTTAVAQRIGLEAGQNRLELDEEQAVSYVGREDVVLRPEQASSCTGTGYVVVTHGNLAYGMGMLRMREEDGMAYLESLFPEAHVGALTSLERMSP